MLLLIFGVVPTGLFRARTLVKVPRLVSPFLHKFLSCVRLRLLACKTCYILEMGRGVAPSRTLPLAPATVQATKGEELAQEVMRIRNSFSDNFGHTLECVGAVSSCRCAYSSIIKQLDTLGLTLAYGPDYLHKAISELGRLVVDFPGNLPCHQHSINLCVHVTLIGRVINTLFVQVSQLVEINDPSA